MGQPDVNKEDLRSEAWDNALYCFATATIFEKRASGLLIKIKALKFFSIGVPVLLGAVVLSFGTDLIGKILPVFGGLAVIQLTLNVWAIVGNWEEKYAYLIESIADNHRLSSQFKDLGRLPPDDKNKLLEKLEQLKIADHYRSANDYKQSITDKEKIYGHRAALRQFKRECVECGVVPTSMEPKNCNVCGNF